MSDAYTHLTIRYRSGTICATDRCAKSESIRQPKTTQQHMAQDSTTIERRTSTPAGSRPGCSFLLLGRSDHHSTHQSRPYSRVRTVRPAFVSRSRGSGRRTLLTQPVVFMGVAVADEAVLVPTVPLAAASVPTVRAAADTGGACGHQRLALAITGKPWMGYAAACAEAREGQAAGAGQCGSRRPLGSERAMRNAMRVVPSAVHSVKASDELGPRCSPGHQRVVRIALAIGRRGLSTMPHGRAANMGQSRWQERAVRVAMP